jgi:FMN reductase
MTLVKTVVVSGSSSAGSKTLTLAQRILAAVADEVAVDARVIDIAEIGSDIGRALARRDLSSAAERALSQVEDAQILIAATPVYRGSYSGHFKHLFDLIDQNALIDTPVILAATGGSDKHCLVIEHQLRPLFGFLQSYTVPVGVYASHSDFENGDVRSPIVLARIVTAARQAVSLHEVLVRSKAALIERPNAPLSSQSETRSPEPVRHSH